MKSTIKITLLALSAILLIAGCSGTAETSVENETAATTETSATVVTSASSDTTEAATPTPVPTSAPETKVTVTDAYSNVLINYGYEIPYKIPKVSITGVDTSDLNKMFIDKYSNLEMLDEETGIYWGSTVTYEYYMNDKMLSVVITKTDLDNDFTTYDAYNMMIADGKMIDGKDVVREYGLSDDEFFEKVKTCIVNFNTLWDAGGSDVDEIKKTNLSRLSYEYLIPYIGHEGDLCFLGLMQYPAGSGESYIIFNAMNGRSGFDR